MRRREAAVRECMMVMLPCLVSAGLQRSETVVQGELVRREAERLRLDRDYEGAIRRFEEAYQLDPTNPKGNWGMGRIYLEHSQPQDALPFLQRAVGFAYDSRGEPGFDKARGRLSTRGLDESEAIGAAKGVVHTNNAFSEVISDLALSIMLLDLGVCLGEMAQYSQQIVAFRESSRLRPTNRTFANLQRVRQFMCDWEAWNASMERIATLIASAPGAPEISAMHPTKVSGDLQLVPPQHALYYPMPPDLTLASARLCADLTEARLKAQRLQPYLHELPRSLFSPPFRLKVGILSSQYGANSLGWTLHKFFEVLALPRFQPKTCTYALALTSDDGSATRRHIKRSAEHFVDYSARDVKQIAADINQRGLHILVDVDGYRDVDVVTGISDIAKILSLRPTKLSVNWLGPCASLGSTAVHFILSDKISSPPDYARHFTEALALAPISFSVTTLVESYPNISAALSNISALRAAPASQRTLHLAANRKALGLARRGAGTTSSVPEFAFGDFNKVFKLTPDVFDLWMGLLKARPQSILALGEAEKGARRNLRRNARQVDEGE